MNSIDWSAFFTGLTTFVKSTGLPTVALIILGAWGYKFFSNPPWGKRKFKADD